MNPNSRQDHSKDFLPVVAKWKPAHVIAIAVFALSALLPFRLAVANDAPEFFKNSLPDHAIADILKSFSVFKGDGAALDARTRELIALSVAAQIPCPYCIYGHRRNAIAAGASEAELREAVAAGAYVRLWSSMLQGAEIDFEAFKVEHDKLREGGS